MSEFNCWARWGKIWTSVDPSDTDSWQDADEVFKGSQEELAALISSRRGCSNPRVSYCIPVEYPERIRLNELDQPFYTPDDTMSHEEQVEDFKSALCQLKQVACDWYFSRSFSGRGNARKWIDEKFHWISYGSGHRGDVWECNPELYQEELGKAVRLAKRRRDRVKKHGKKSLYSGFLTLLSRLKVLIGEHCSDKDRKGHPYFTWNSVSYEKDTDGCANELLRILAYIRSKRKYKTIRENISEGVSDSPTALRCLVDLSLSIDYMRVHKRKNVRALVDDVLLLLRAIKKDKREAWQKALNEMTKVHKP